MNTETCEKESFIDYYVHKQLILEEVSFSEDDKIQLFFVSNPISGNVQSLYTT